MTPRLTLDVHPEQAFAQTRRGDPQQGAAGRVVIHVDEQSASLGVGRAEHKMITLRSAERGLDLVVRQDARRETVCLDSDPGGRQLQPRGCTTPRVVVQPEDGGEVRVVGGWRHGV